MTTRRRTRRHSLLRPRRLFARIAALALLGLASVAMAADGSGPSRLVITTGDVETATVHIDGPRVRVVTVDAGETSVHEVDLAGLGAEVGSLVEEVLAGVESSLADLEDGGLTFSLEDGLLTVEEGERVCTVDVAAMATELSSGLREMMRELDRELGHAGGVSWTDAREPDAEQLRDELDALKAEVDRLRDDLQRLR
jgi:hypothetical protein